MPDTDYTYSLASDFSSGLNSSRLDAQIRTSAIRIALAGVSASGDSVVVTFRDALDPSDESILDDVVAVHDGTPLPQEPTPVVITGMTTEDKIGVNTYPSEGIRTNLITHDFTDPTSWYQSSIRVVDEEPTPLDASGKQYQLTHVNIIDLTHGKIFGEDDIYDEDDHPYTVCVKIDGVAKTQAHPDTGVGEWSIDYAKGVITLNPNAPSGSAVTVTYHYATDSKFSVIPIPGRLLRMSSAEVQFSTDVSLRTTVVFQVTGWCAAIDPVGFAAGDYGADPYLQIPASAPTKYKGIRDFLSESNGVYPLAVRSHNNNPTWRDMKNDVLTFPWQYQTTINIMSSAGLRITVSLVDDVPLSGEYVSATFYCYSDIDPNY